MSKHRVEVPGSERFTRSNAHTVGAPDPNEILEITLRLRALKPVDSISALPVTSHKVSERKYKSRKDFAADHGADPKDVAAVEAFATQHSLSLGHVDLARRTVNVSGTVSQLSAAFGVYLACYEHPGGTYRGRTGPIYVSGDLDGIVEGVFGLDNRRQARPHFRHRKLTKSTSRAAFQGYDPREVAALYNFPADTDGTGECIGIIEFGGGYTAADLSTYFEQLGLPVPQISAVSVDGVANTPAPGSDSPDAEVALDIEVAGAVAPGAKIVVYFAPFTERGWVDVITTAVHDSVHNPSVLSISWGYPEGKAIWSRQAIRVLDEAFQAAAAMGVTVCVASGDDGSRDEVNDGRAHVDFPAASAYVLACGGTTLTSEHGKITKEVVWNDGEEGGASGGGVSADVRPPTWQADAKVPPSVNRGHHEGRGVPDISGNADPATGYHIYFDGQGGVVGGTSAVAPLWAALVARLNQKLGKAVGFLNPAIYGQVQQAGALRDITSGNNDITGTIGGYPAGAGWDACTGYGSPDGQAILTVLTGTKAAVS